MLPRLVNELPTDALSSLKLAFNVNSARSVEDLFEKLNDRATFTGANAQENLDILLFVLEPNYPNVAVVETLRREFSSSFNKADSSRSVRVAPFKNIVDDGKPFVGRSLETVQKLVQPGRRNVVAFISGDVPGGSGKTTYARRAALALQSIFPYHLIEVDWTGVVSTMQEILRLLNRPLLGGNVRNQYRAASSEILKDSVLLVDGLNSEEDALEVEALFPSESVSCCVLITSRWRLSLSYSVPVDVGIFEEPVSVELLQRLFSLNRRDIPVSILPRFASCCGNIPLALATMAGVCISQTSRTAESICDMLDADPGERVQRTTLAKCFLISYKCISNAAQQAWRRVAIWTAPVTEKDFHAVFDSPAGVLHELHASAQLTFRSSTFHMHDTVRDFLGTLISTDEREKECDLIVRKYYWVLLKNLDSLVTTGTAQSISEATKIFAAHRTALEMFLRGWLLGKKRLKLADVYLLETASKYPNVLTYYLPAELLESLYSRAVSLSNGPDIKILHARVLQRCGKHQAAVTELNSLKCSLLFNHMHQGTFPHPLHDSKSCAVLRMPLRFVMPPNARLNVRLPVSSPLTPVMLSLNADIAKSLGELAKWEEAASLYEMMVRVAYTGQGTCEHDPYCRNSPSLGMSLATTHGRRSCTSRCATHRDEQDSATGNLKC